jgi:hypothetical protein
MNHRTWRRVTTGAVITTGLLIPGAYSAHAWDQPLTVPALVGIGVAAAVVVVGHLGETRTAPRRPSPYPRINP